MSFAWIIKGRHVSYLYHVKQQNVLWCKLARLNIMWQSRLTSCDWHRFMFCNKLWINMCCLVYSQIYCLDGERGVYMYLPNFLFMDRDAESQWKSNIDKHSHYRLYLWTQAWITSCKFFQSTPLTPVYFAQTFLCLLFAGGQKSWLKNYWHMAEQWGIIVPHLHLLRLGPPNPQTSILGSFVPDCAWLLVGIPVHMSHTFLRGSFDARRLHLGLAPLLRAHSSPVAFSLPFELPNSSDIVLRHMHGCSTTIGSVRLRCFTDVPGLFAKWRE